MNLLSQIEHWGDRHHPAWIDIIRIALGIFLIYKGIDFLRHMSDLVGFMSASSSSFSEFSYVLAGHYTVGARILGGLFLALGLFTRAACLMQLPVLLGAIFFVGSNPEMLSPYSEMGLTILVFLLLVYFLIVGNGPWAVKLPDERNQ